MPAHRTETEEEPDVTGAPPPFRLALTPGEPAGIGPDICLRLAQGDGAVELVAFADPELLERRAREIGLPILLKPLEPAEPPTGRLPGQLTVVPCDTGAPVHAGRLDPANAPYVLETLRSAVDACRDGRCAGLVTGPVHKGVINDAGIGFTGHTEYLAELTGAYPVMMLACPQLRVALATTHLPLKEVSEAITAERLERVLTVLDRDLRRRFACARPRILVCGLNPHAGEGGHLGREEIDVIVPTLAKLADSGLDLTGPLPADTAFTPRALAGADAVLAMYHDQGLPVLKHIGFGQAVNITLGLPIVRTSVDHGTALELAGSGRADHGSLAAAVAAAAELAAAERTVTGGD